MKSFKEHATPEQIYELMTGLEVAQEDPVPARCLSCKYSGMARYVFQNAVTHEKKEFRLFSCNNPFPKWDLTSTMPIETQQYALGHLDEFPPLACVISWPYCKGTHFTMRAAP
jgi:hypothetical protein